VGNLTRAPELRHIPSGLAVTDITLAVNDRRKSATGDWIEEVSFVDVTLWGRWAEIVCQYTTKGSSLFVEGRLKQESWESEGQKRSKLKVIGERSLLMGGPGGGGGSGGGNRGGDDDGGYARQGTRSSGRSSQPASSDYYDTPQDGDEVPF
jgi:single-strand DNA-binding protein